MKRLNKKVQMEEFEASQFYIVVNKNGIYELRDSGDHYTLSTGKYVETVLGTLYSIVTRYRSYTIYTKARRSLDVIPYSITSMENRQMEYNLNKNLFRAEIKATMTRAKESLGAVKIKKKERLQTIENTSGSSPLALEKKTGEETSATIDKRPVKRLKKVSKRL